MHLAPLVLTAGEPAGIGPDLVLSLAASNQLKNTIVIADPTLLTERAKILNLSLNMQEISIGAHLELSDPHTLFVHPVPCAAQSEAGQLNVENSAYVIECLKVALNSCMNKSTSAMVTAPVHKKIIDAAGFEFTGHTEWLARQCRCDPEKVVMLLVSDSLKVALVTTHLPLKKVPEAINQNSVSNTIEILNSSLIEEFNLDKPTIAVCGLNPHAGEDGLLGEEEILIIQPVIDKLKAQGLNLIGPCSADSIFTEKMRSEYDAVVTMYHDQGLPTLKQLSFGRAVNVTLGLPIIRTSVDHGTALSLAATGKASAESLNYACQVAREMALARAANYG